MILDFNMANSLVKFLREEADKGKTIICTIHQPSSRIFHMFDKYNNKLHLEKNLFLNIKLHVFSKSMPISPGKFGLFRWNKNR